MNKDPEQRALGARHLAFALIFLLSQDPGALVHAQNVDYPVSSMYEMPKPLTFKAKKADIGALDADTKALVEQLRAGSPTAVAYSQKAHGALIFPRVETSNYFLLGETKAFGVLYVKNKAGEYEKHGYYFGERDSLGFLDGSQTSSRVLMFMSVTALQEFIAGNIHASYMVVDTETGETAGEPDADVAVFITNVEGNVGDLSFKGLKIVPVDVIE